MISVLTLTYKRSRLLEEAIYSFLSQDFTGACEMVIINDCSQLRYYYDDPRIRIINVPTRFGSLGEKLRFGISQCRYNAIYRLDDDDLLTPWALRQSVQDIYEHPGYDIYRSSQAYCFVNNIFEKMSSNVNNGNIFMKEYLNRIVIPAKSFAEDQEMLSYPGVKIYENMVDRMTMIYRWGMNTYHVSGLGDKPAEWINERVDQLKSDENGLVGNYKVTLEPHFDVDYYAQLPK